MKARLLSLICYPTEYWHGADETLIKVYGNQYDEFAKPMRNSTPWHLHVDIEFGTQAVIEVWDRHHGRTTHAVELHGVHYIDRFGTAYGLNKALFTLGGAQYELTYEMMR